MQAFFWIRFRLFPTLPPALLTAAAIDAAQPLLMLQKHSGLKQSRVTHQQGKPRQRQWFDKGIPNMLDGLLITPGQQRGAAPAAPDSSAPPGSSGAGSSGMREAGAGGSFPGSWPAFAELPPRPCWCTGPCRTTCESPGQEAKQISLLFERKQNAGW